MPVTRSNRPALLLVGALIHLTLVGSAAGQNPSPAPSPVVPLPPILTPDFQERMRDLEEHIREQETRFREQQRHVWEHVEKEAWQEAEKLLSHQFTMPKLDLHLPDFDADFKLKGFPEYGQAPVPPAPPVPSRVGRGPDRKREPRRRIPEGWVETTEPFSRSFQVGKAPVLLVVNVSGNIQVAGAGSQIEVEALKRVWAPNAEDGKRRLADVSIEVYATANRVELRVEHNPGRNTGNVDVEFNIKVPADGSVDLRSVSGDLRVTNVRGEVRAEAVNGNLALEGTPRLTKAKTVGGDIQLTNAGADTLLSLSTVNGDVLVQTLNARTLELNTVNGDVRIAGWAGDRATLRTLSGDLDLSGSLAKSGRYDIESHSGDVRLAVADQPGFDIEANTYSGRIRIDFSIKSEGPVRDVNRGPRSVRGTYGDAASSLRVQTFSGDIVVTRR
jgi:hypothetical protein